MQYVVLWDEEAKRGWLLNGASALLHLLRASLDHDSVDPIFRHIWGKVSKRQSEEPGIEAVDVLLSLIANRKFKISVGDEYLSLEDRFESLYDVLKKLIIDCSNYRYPSGRDREKRNLKGWDFVDIARYRGVLFSRTTKLRSSSTAWVNLIMDIGAVPLLGRGFGEIIQPADSKNPNSLWTPLPEGRHYLAAFASHLRRIANLYDTSWTSNIPPSRCIPFKFCHSTAKVFPIDYALSLERYGAVILSPNSVLKKS